MISGTFHIVSTLYQKWQSPLSFNSAAPNSTSGKNLHLDWICTVKTNPGQGYYYSGWKKKIRGSCRAWLNYQGIIRGQRQKIRRSSRYGFARGAGNWRSLKVGSRPCLPLGQAQRSRYRSTGEAPSLSVPVCPRHSLGADAPSPLLSLSSRALRPLGCVYRGPRNALPVHSVVSSSRKKWYRKSLVPLVS